LGAFLTLLDSRRPACFSGFHRFFLAGRRFVLVLTRKSNQSIMIGDEIEVSVLAIMGEKVRIGIEAPRSVPVFRKEVYVEIQQDRNAEGEKEQVDEALERLKTAGE
jgi:carbon storage regulator